MRRDFLAADKTCKAVFWVPSSGDLNFCVCIMPPNHKLTCTVYLWLDYKVVRVLNHTNQYLLSAQLSLPFWALVGLIADLNHAAQLLGCQHSAQCPLHIFLLCHSVWMADVSHMNYEVLWGTENICIDEPHLVHFLNHRVL